MNNFLIWFLTTIIGLVQMLIGAYMLAIFIYFLTRLLVSFGGVSAHNPVVQFILQIGSSLIEPVLKPIRRVVPMINGIDLSIMALWIILYVISSFLGFLAGQIALSGLR
ncbi:YggT family protein [Ponticaulis profundi]|uniref:YggT family protein n=1 Tax=Ponticaulis profundi TaxID=2665222 RepID=A0ABW1S7B4_9PROT